ncbi:hypothetical protein EJ04DRAFT_110590 [Polyplosphaeria fusca]|uniref:Uncharacterized protein n=1 Tax=Polyplosphaeria fusca TaxID=682080 RepID=A0A9P4UWS1_9PLEO|nr:hypothetical protein EJ04DRAFT_110590 [Polyplosphaeria fusca]
MQPQGHAEGKAFGRQEKRVRWECNASAGWIFEMRITAPLVETAFGRLPEFVSRSAMVYRGVRVDTCAGNRCPGLPNPCNHALARWGTLLSRSRQLGGGNPLVSLPDPKPPFDWRALRGVCRTVSCCLTFLFCSAILSFVLSSLFCSVVFLLLGSSSLSLCWAAPLFID